MVNLSEDENLSHLPILSYNYPIFLYLELGWKKWRMFKLLVSFLFVTEIILAWLLV